MIPSGFRVNGVQTEEIPSRLKKLTDLLDRLADDDLLTSIELASRLRVSRSGDIFSHSSLVDYREKTGSKLFWGNKKTIIKLRAELSEGTSDQT